MVGMCVEGIKNQKIRKQKLELMNVGASRLDIYKTMYKVLRQSIRNRVSTSTSKMDHERRRNCGGGKVT